MDKPPGVIGTHKRNLSQVLCDFRDDAKVTQVEMGAMVLGAAVAFAHSVGITKEDFLKTASACFDTMEPRAANDA